MTYDLYKEFKVSDKNLNEKLGETALKVIANEAQKHTVLLERILRAVEGSVVGTNESVGSVETMVTERPVDTTNQQPIDAMSDFMGLTLQEKRKHLLELGIKGHSKSDTTKCVGAYTHHLNGTYQRAAEEMAKQMVRSVGVANAEEYVDNTPPPLPTAKPVFELTGERNEDGLPLAIEKTRKPRALRVAEEQQRKAEKDLLGHTGPMTPEEFMAMGSIDQ